MSTLHKKHEVSKHINMLAKKNKLCVPAAVLDNLVKGATGQALQNMNLLMGVPETTGLLQQAIFP